MVEKYSEDRIWIFGVLTRKISFLKRKNGLTRKTRLTVKNGVLFWKLPKRACDASFVPTKKGEVEKKRRSEHLDSKSSITLQLSRKMKGHNPFVLTDLKAFRHEQQKPTVFSIS